MFFEYIQRNEFCHVFCEIAFMAQDLIDDNQQWSTQLIGGAI